MTPEELNYWESRGKREEAEAVEKLLGFQFKVYRKKLEDMRAQSKSLKEALEKIAHKQHFEVLRNEPLSLARFNALKEQGDVAREALSKFEAWSKEWLARDDADILN